MVITYNFPLFISVCSTKFEPRDWTKSAGVFWAYMQCTGSFHHILFFSWRQPGS